MTWRRRHTEVRVDWLFLLCLVVVVALVVSVGWHLCQGVCGAWFTKPTPLQG